MKRRLERLFAATLVCVALPLGCGPARLESPKAQTDERLHQFAAAVLESLSRGDTARLRSLRVSETVHNQEIWPELPASKPPINFPVDEAWSNIQRRNQRATERLRPFFEQREVVLAEVECLGLEQFETFQVRTDCRVRFEDGDGVVYQATLFKDLVDRRGVLRTFRYYADPSPRPLPKSRTDSDGSRNR